MELVDVRRVHAYDLPEVLIEQKRWNTTMWRESARANDGAWVSLALIGEYGDEDDRHPEGRQLGDGLELTSEDLNRPARRIIGCAIIVPQPIYDQVILDTLIVDKPWRSDVLVQAAVRACEKFCAQYGRQLGLRYGAAASHDPKRHIAMMDGGDHGPPVIVESLIRWDLSPEPPAPEKEEHDGGADAGPGDARPDEPGDAGPGADAERVRPAVHRSGSRKRKRKPASSE
jgi:hypothetical protein